VSSKSEFGVKTVLFESQMEDVSYNKSIEMLNIWVKPMIKRQWLIKLIFVSLISLNVLLFSQQTVEFPQELTGDQLYEEGVKLYKQEKYQEALPCFQEATRRKANFAEAHFQLGMIYFKLERPKEELAAYEKVIQIDPNFIDAHINSGIAYIVLDKWQEALLCFKESIRIDPGTAKNHFLLGVVYDRMEKYEEAINAFKKAVQIKPDFAKAYLSMGGSYIRFNKRQEAMDSFKQVVNLEPNNADTQWMIGLLHSDMGQHKEAVDAFKQAIRINPDFSDAYANLGKSYIHLGQYQEAVDVFEQALHIKPDDVKAQENLKIAKSALQTHQKSTMDNETKPQVNPEIREEQGVTIETEPANCQVKVYEWVPREGNKGDIIAEGKSPLKFPEEILKGNRGIVITVAAKEEGYLSSDQIFFAPYNFSFNKVKVTLQQDYAYLARKAEIAGSVSRKEEILEKHESISHPSVHDEQIRPLSDFPKAISQGDVKKAEKIADYMFAGAMEGKQLWEYWKALDRVSGEIAFMAYEHLATNALEMKLTLAETYMKLGKYSDAKRIFRWIITTYTGEHWKGYTKKAEFGLEDLKELEKK
jgi:tetratricopeptide (TPR) repeat protein